MNFIPTFWSIRYCIIAKKKKKSQVMACLDEVFPISLKNANETSQQLKDNYLITT